MKIIIELKSSPAANTLSIPLDELGYTSDEWFSLAAEDQNAVIQEYIDGENETNRPYWELKKAKTEQ